MKYSRVIGQRADTATATLDPATQAKVDALPSVWQPNTPYTDGQGVIYNGAIYVKNGNGNSGATFTPSNWVSGTDTNTQLYRGLFDASGGAVPTAAAATIRPGEPILEGEFFSVSVAGNISGIEVQPNNILLANQDNPTAIGGYYVVGSTSNQQIWAYAVATDDPGFATPLDSKQGYVLPDGGSVSLNAAATDGDWWYLWNPSNTQSVNVRFAGGTWEGEIISATQDATLQPSGLYHVRKLGTVAHIARIDNLSGDVVQHIGHAFTLPTVGFIAVRHDGTNYVQATSTLEAEAAIVRIYTNDFYRVSRNAQIHTGPHGLTPGKYLVLDTAGNAVEETVPGPQRVGYITDANTILVDIDSGGTGTPTSTLWESTTNGQTLTPELQYVGTPGEAYTIPALNPGEEVYMNVSGTTGQTTLNLPDGVQFRNYSTQTVETTAGSSYLVAAGRMVRVYRNPNTDVYEVADWFSNTDFQIVGLDENRACPNTTGLQFTVQAVNVSAGPITYSIVGSGGAVANPTIDSNTGVVTYDSPTPINNGLGYIDISATDSNSKVVTQRIQIQQAPPLEESGLGGNDNLVRFSTPFGAGDTRILSYIEQDTETDSAGNTQDNLFTDVAGTTSALSGESVINILNSGGGSDWFVPNDSIGMLFNPSDTPSGKGALLTNGVSQMSLANHNASPSAGDAFAFSFVYKTNSPLPEFGAILSIGNESSGVGNLNLNGSLSIERAASPSLDFNLVITGGNTYTISPDVDNEIGDGNYHLFTLQYDGANISAWIDGVVKVNNQPAGIALLSNTVRLMRGALVYDSAITSPAFFGEFGLPNTQGWSHSIGGSGATISINSTTRNGLPVDAVRIGDNSSSGIVDIETSLNASVWTTIQNTGCVFGGTIRLDASDGSEGAVMALQANSAENPVDSLNRRFIVVASNNGGNLQLNDLTGGDVTFDGTGGNPTIAFDEWVDISIIIEPGELSNYASGSTANVYVNNQLVNGFGVTFGTNNGGLGTKLLISSGSTGGVNRVFDILGFGIWYIPTQGGISDFIILDNPTLEQVDRMQANLLFRHGFPLSNLASNAAPYSRDALFYTAPSDYILQTYCDGSVQVYDSNSGTYFDETNMPVPGIGLFLGANALAVINEAQSGGGVQSVTGAAVDNTDPLNPVITSSGGPADTDALPEGSTNLYYTEARVNANPNVATNTAKTGITTLQANSIAANNAKVSADGSINSHSDVDTSTTAPTNGQALTFDGTNWVPTSLASSPSGLQNSIQLTGDIAPSAFTEPTAALYWNTSSNSHTVTLTDANWPVGSVVHFINFNNLGNIQVSMSGASILDASDVLTSYPVYGGSKLTLTKVATSSWLILNHTDQLIGEANLTGGSQQLLTAGSLTFANAYTTYRALRYEFVAVEGANRYSLGAAYSESVSDFITAVMSDTAASPLVAFSLNSGNQNIAIAAGLGAGATNYDSLEVKVYGVR